MHLIVELIYLTLHRDEELQYCCKVWKPSGQKHVELDFLPRGGERRQFRDCPAQKLEFYDVGNFLGIVSTSSGKFDAQ